MNSKRGLTRLFVLGLTISVIVGFVMVQKPLNSTSEFYRDQITKINSEIKYLDCLDMLKLNNKNDLPDFFNYNGPCRSILLSWDDIKDRQIKTKTTEIDMNFIEETLREHSFSYQRDLWIGTIFGYPLLYVLFCFISWLIFLVMRWVKRGFSN